jgi:hypothetical protein
LFIFRSGLTVTGLSRVYCTYNYFISSFTQPSCQQLSSFEWYYDQWSGKYVEGRGRGLFRGAVLEFAWRMMKNSNILRIVAVATEIRNANLPNVGHKL